VFTRVALAVLAVLVLAWVGVLARNHELGTDAALRAFFGPRLDQAGRERDLDRLEDAQFLDPNSYWRLARANYLMVDGDTAAARRTAESLVSDEPENIFAWGTLRLATTVSDPRRAAQAAAEIRRLNPLGSR
jgi:hypothetical protein